MSRQLWIERNNFEENKIPYYNSVDWRMTGQIIKYCACKYGYKKREIGKVINVNEDTIKKYYQGKYAIPVERLYGLSTLFKVSINDLLVLKGDIEHYIRKTGLLGEDIQTDDKYIGLFQEYKNNCPIKNFVDLGLIFYNLEEPIQEDVRRRIFDHLMSGRSYEEAYVQNMFIYCYENTNNKDDVENCIQQHKHIRERIIEENKIDKTILPILVSRGI